VLEKQLGTNEPEATARKLEVINPATEDLKTSRQVKIRKANANEPPFDASKCSEMTHSRVEGIQAVKASVLSPFTTKQLAQRLSLAQGARESKKRHTTLSAAHGRASPTEFSACSEKGKALAR
jgi:hypothetical protein